jgi:hypothetical protein
MKKISFMAQTVKRTFWGIVSFHVRQLPALRNVNETVGRTLLE